ncbi:hypothetical protein B296_00049217 [Ensete ventricosum]|uniref:Uncharacterized protein n=1 Tax=Ensete ventricosum TaxID=4639 RepID=A0A426XDV5_ENSVE|nr:hypothetical protein B296_00049217 [Ensete ventricosum]
MQYLRTCPVRDTIIRRAAGSSTSVNNATARRAVDSKNECHAAGELDYFSAHIRLREPGKSEDKAELMQECSTKERSKQYAVPYLFYSEE